MNTMAHLTFDPAVIPFSRRGSWMGFSWIPPERIAHRGLKAGLYLRTMQGAIAGGREIFRMELRKGQHPVPFRATGSPSELCLKSERAEASACFIHPSRILFKGRGAALSFKAEPVCYATLREAGTGRWEVNLMAQRVQLMISLRKGRVRVNAPWRGVHCSEIQFEVLPDDAGEWEMEMEEFATAWSPPRDFPDADQARSGAAKEFASWLDATQNVPARWRKTRELAAYVHWSSLVEARGWLRRETMLMSKNWMTNVWSWDHCFNAIALVKHDPALAWDQWAVVFDLQNAAGALPDCANNADVVWNFCKPPVHGWALGQMRRHGLVLTSSQTRQACRWLEQWTEWWLLYRDEDADGVPQYNHGNDSGWDNATCFSHGMPVEGPDLAAFLILQMEEISHLRASLGQGKLARNWARRAGQLWSRMSTHSWRGDHFVAPRSGDHTVAEGDSLVPFIPLILGTRLAPGQRRHLVHGLRRFITPYGVATENPRSPFYVPDGYWRGPVWAPTTYLIVEGLRSCGEKRLANDLARRFCRACAKGGMAENFNAKTGAGLRDRAYSWTASVFLLLAPLAADQHQTK